MTSPIEISCPPFSLQLETARCLNQRHQQAGCDRCQTACPLNAIALDGAGHPSLNEKCAQCGLCLHICPAGVFIQADGWNESRVELLLDNLSEAPIEVLCSHHTDLRPVSINANILQLPVCLAALSPAAWLELSLHDDTQARLDLCASCHLADVIPQITMTLKRASELAQNFSNAGRIYASLRPQEKSISTRPILNAANISLSRRAFLRTLGKTATYGLATSLTSSAFNPSSFSTLTVSKQPLPHVPAWIKRLRALFTRQSGRSTQASEWSSLSLRAECAACGECARYCPSGALTFRQAGRLFSLAHTPALCVECNLCLLACPLESLVITKKEQPQPFQSQSVHSGKTAVCSRCRSPISEERGDLCIWCAQEPSPAPMLAEARFYLLNLKKLKNRF